MKNLKWYDHIFINIVPPIGALLIKSLMSSCKVIYETGLERIQKALHTSKGKAVYVTWHQRMSYNFHLFGPKHLTMIISLSRDGEYAVKTAQLLGFRAVRGSSSRGGIRALKGMIEKINSGASGGVLADGPQGPPRIAKMGAILIARETGVPIIPVTWGADRCWVLNSWDRYMIPKPFAHISLFYGEPMWIPKQANKQKLEKYRLILEKSLNYGTEWCDKRFGVKRPWCK